MEKYQLIKSKYLEELRSQARFLRHIKSGAGILLLENDDENKVFQIGFRTPPTDDTGVPHIMEHSTLCGSEKFPVKEPFVELLKGSLNTFLNAMTFPDQTVYPVASCNDKDFANLMEVYMDAVFFPNVYKHEEIFKQEGWHYELESPDGPLIYNGVVYNEMKGAFSGAEQVVNRASWHALFPDTAYGKESGGDPDYIPDLTYQDFVAFHKRFYHPSNSYICLYGKMNMEEKLEWMDREYLSRFDRITVDSALTKQKPFTEPHYEEVFYPIGKDESKENKTFYSWNAVIDDARDVEISLAFQILSYVLLEAPGAPLKQKLLDSGIARDIIGGFEGGVLQPVFNVIAKDAKDGQTERFTEIIKAELKEEVVKGIDTKALKAALNYYEFKYREADFGSIPKGLVYTLNVMNSWLHDENDPFSRLETNAVFASLKAKTETDFYEGLIDKYLLRNNHVAIVTVSPSNTLGAEKEEALKIKLCKYKETLTPEEIEQLIADTKKLKLYQQTPSAPEDVAKIPILTRDDISREIISVPNRLRMTAGVKIIEQNIFTNGIAYLTMLFDTKNVPKRLIPYLRLLSAMLGNVDTEHYSYADLSKEIMINTGGIEATMSVYQLKNNDLRPFLTINASSLTDKIGFVFEIIEEIIGTSNFDDDKRLFEIIAETKSRMQMNLINHPATVVRRAWSYFRSSAYYNDLINGIGQYRFVAELADSFESKAEEIKNNLKETIRYVFRKENLLLSYTGKKEAYEPFTAHFVQTLNTDPIEPEPFVFIPDYKNEGFKTPSRVQYCAKAGDFSSKGKYTGALEVMKMALQYNYLWMRIRVMGGAYGVMCEFTRDGDVLLGSYRDPNLKKTLDVFDGIIDFIDNFQPTEAEITKCIIGAIGSLDTPLTPRRKGLRALSDYITGLTDEDRLRQRLEVIDTDAASLRALKDMLSEALRSDALCVIGNEDEIVKNKELFKEIKNLYR